MTGDSSKPGAQKPKKLPRLPANARVEKRPLLRPPIASKNASAASPKVVYISSRTPFVSAAKRVRKLLALADARAVQSRAAHVPKNARDRIERVAAAAAERGDGEEQERVWIKGTGRSVAKALQLAVYFQAREELRVELRTGSLWAVDDVVAGGDAQEDAGKGEGSGDEGDAQTRMRQTSLLEVAVSMR